MSSTRTIPAPALELDTGLPARPTSRAPPHNQPARTSRAGHTPPMMNFTNSFGALPVDPMGDKQDTQNPDRLASAPSKSHKKRHRRSRGKGGGREPGGGGGRHRGNGGGGDDSGDDGPPSPTATTNSDSRRRANPTSSNQDAVNMLADVLSRAFQRTQHPTHTSTKNYASKPEPFNGDKARYETWKNALDLYILGVNGHQDKIIAALSFMTSGRASAWAIQWRADHGHALMADKLSWEDFEAALDKYFRDPREEEKARADLFTMRIGYKEDAHTFLIRFGEKRTKAHMADTVFDRQITEHLERTLPGALVNAVKQTFTATQEAEEGFWKRSRNIGMISPAAYEIAMQDVGQPCSFEKFKDLAIKCDPTVRPHAYTLSTGQMYMESRDARPARLPEARAERSAPAQTPTAPVPRPRSPDVKPMDIDRTEARRKGLCFVCQQPGHLASAHKKAFRTQVRMLVDQGQLDEEDAADMIGNLDEEEEGFPKL